MANILSKSFVIVVYSAQNNLGIIGTIKIESIRDIGEQIDASIYESKYSGEPNTFQISNNVIGVDNEGQGNGGTLKEMRTSSDGNMWMSSLESLLDMIQ